MIINSYEEYNKLVSRMDSESHIATPIHRDLYAHNIVNPILCVGVSFLNNDFYIISISHNDAPKFEVPDMSKRLNYELIAYLLNNELADIKDLYTPYMNDTANIFRDIGNVNKLIPITLWSAIIRNHHKKYLTVVKDNQDIVHQTAYQFMNKAIHTLSRIEQAGLAVDIPTFDTFFENKSKRLVTNGLVYSQYFPYTTTGRPSNRFGGVNFSALNKSDGSRETFISRFENGSLIQMDFESYHLRLIGGYLGIDMPNTPIHKYLATKYYEKDDISQEEYDEAKQITFSILYGADIDTDIPILKSIKQLSKTLYESYKAGDGLIAPLSGRRIHIAEEEATENKLFNYFVQSFEFERTVLELEKVLDYLEGKKSKLILYTYDAVLLDCHPDEIDEISSQCRTILGSDTYPIRTYAGRNYNILKEVF